METFLRDNPVAIHPITYLLTITGFRLARYHHHLSTNVQPTLLTSRRTDLDPVLSHPGLILSFTSDIQSSPSSSLTIRYCSAL